MNRDTTRICMGRSAGRWCEPRHNFHFLKYRVDFAPELDCMGVRKSLVRQHEQQLGKYLFDGKLMFNVVRLPQPLTVHSACTLDKLQVAITFVLIGEVKKEDPINTSLINVILIRCLETLNFNPGMAPNNLQSILALALRPDCISALHLYLNSFSLEVEIIYKKLDRDTAFDVINKIRKGEGDLQSSIRAELKGKIVLTHYNKKTFQIDDIDFTMNPMSPLIHHKKGRNITYFEYYKKHYEVEVRNNSQPLLVCRPSRLDVNCGYVQPVYLIPELCGMTGLSVKQNKRLHDRRMQALIPFRNSVNGYTSMSIHHKEMIQLNAKIDAELQIGRLPQKESMFCGYSLKKHYQKTVGVFFSVFNQALPKYFYTVYSLESDDKVDLSLSDHVGSSLHAYFKLNGSWPTKIIIYRDAVGFNDIARLRETEVDAVRKACNDLPPNIAPNYNPGIAFLMVSQRMGDCYDFSLVSQKITEATVSPTCYYVVNDSSAIPHDIHQRLAYALSFYWPGTLRVPVPIHYARKFAYIAARK